MLPQRFWAEEAVPEDQLPPDHCGPHHALQGGAQVRSQLPKRHKHTHPVSPNAGLTVTLSEVQCVSPCFYVARLTLESVEQEGDGRH